MIATVADHLRSLALAGMVTLGLMAFAIVCGLVLASWEWLRTDKELHDR